MGDASTREMNWFEVAGKFAFMMGAKTRVVGVGVGYEKSLDHARDLIARPHDPAPAAELQADCEDLAALLVQIAAEDGHTTTVANCLRAMLLDAARRETRAAEPDGNEETL